MLRAVTNNGYSSGVIQSSVATLGLAPAQNTAYTQAGDATNGVIVNVQLPALGTFYGCRLLYQNYSTTVPLVFDGIKVSPAAVSITPGNGSLTGWSAFVTASGSQTVTVPVATTTSTGTIIPGVVITDFIPVTSIARTDTVGAPPILRIASHIQPSASTTTHPGLTQTPLTGLNGATANPGLITAAATWTGTANTLANLTTTAANTATYGSPINPITALFYYGPLAKDVWVFGDSIPQGFGTASQVTGITEYMTFNTYSATATVLYGGSNFSQQGQTLANSEARLKAIVGAAITAGMKPKYVLWKNWSPNDGGGSQAIFNTDFAITMDVITYLEQNGIIPIVCTSPFASGTSTLSYLQAANAQVLALPSSVLKIDLFNLMTPGGVWIPAYNSGDGVHPNDAGMSVWGNALANAVASI